MTYFAPPVLPTLPLVDYTISSKADMDALVTATVLTKIDIGDGYYRYLFPSGSFGITALIDLEDDQIGILPAATTSTSIVGMNPGVAGFTSIYPGPTLRIAGSTDLIPATHDRVLLQGIVLTNTSTAGSALLVGGSGTTPMQRVSVLGCTLKQGPVSQNRVVKLHGGFSGFVGCDFTKADGYQYLYTFVDVADVSDGYGLASFNACSFHGRAPVADTDATQTSAAVSTYGSTAVMPATNYSFEGCFFANLSYIAFGFNNNLPNMSFTNCSVHRCTNFLFLRGSPVTRMRRFTVRDVNISNITAFFPNNIPLVADVERCYNLTAPTFYDNAYGSYDIVTFTSTGTQNNFGDDSFRAAELVKFNTAGVTITGLTSTGLAPSTKSIFNIGAGTTTLSHNSTSSSVGNRILCSTGADIVLAATVGMGYAQYDYLDGYWRVWT